MAIKILIKRKFKERNINEISKALRDARHGAMEQEGYISSETLWDYDDPYRVVVASMWQSIENWKNWKNSEQRKVVESQFDKLIDGPTEYDIYVLGLYPH